MPGNKPAVYVEKEQRWFGKKEAAQMKAFVDQETCTGCGLCAETCPEVFAIEQGTARVKVDPVPAAAEATCRTAVEECPVTAISIEE